MAHTPGPWQLDIPAATSHSTTLRGGPARTPIAEILKPGLRFQDSHRGPRYSDEYQVNARLIAAAPDLLAALQAFRDWSDSGDCEDAAAEDALDSAMGLCRAAIAKVEGR